MPLAFSNELIEKGVNIISEYAIRTHHTNFICFSYNFVLYLKMSSLDICPSTRKEPLVSLGFIQSSSTIEL